MIHTVRAQLLTHMWRILPVLGSGRHELNIRISTKMISCAVLPISWGDMKFVHIYTRKSSGNLVNHSAFNDYHDHRNRCPENPAIKHLFLSLQSQVCFCPYTWCPSFSLNLTCSALCSPALFMKTGLSSSMKSERACCPPWLQVRVTGGLCVIGIII